MKVALSSGHGAKISGAVGPAPWGLHEHSEAVRVVDQVAKDLRNLGVEVVTFEDKTSTNQQQNLHAIVAWTNAQHADLAVSIHFNSTDPETGTDKPIGTECFYITQWELAQEVCHDVSAASGLINRGAKKNSSLAFLRNTTAPAILEEVCFVMSRADAGLYERHFDAIAEAIASAIAGVQEPLPEQDWRPDITATVFAGADDPQDSAYGTGKIDGDKPGASLPYKWRGSPPPDLIIRGSKGEVRAPIVDVGPWNTDDPNYVLEGERPLAEIQHDEGVPAQNGMVPSNDAGIDLTPATAKAVGISGKGLVDWRFAELVDV